MLKPTKGQCIAGDSLELENGVRSSGRQPKCLSLSKEDLQSEDFGGECLTPCSWTCPGTMSSDSRFSEAGVYLARASVQTVHDDSCSFSGMGLGRTRCLVRSSQRLSADKLRPLSTALQPAPRNVEGVWLSIAIGDQFSAS
eukprot:TRINITY_DN12563_c0_g2_i3.p1 TRINITY_DN12563_c0_g2~~TRINITY_DN12563_c0_g2_i3.p1  ORF type:complete len:141 (-),score=6.75 TRINITY_DN12563_c0_g2_i3:169-591(-)